MVNLTLSREWSIDYAKTQDLESDLRTGSLDNSWTSSQSTTLSFFFFFNLQKFVS